MAPNPFCLDADQSTEEALRMLLGNVFHAIIVTKGEQVVGIITPHDFLEYMYELIKS